MVWKVASRPRINISESQLKVISNLLKLSEDQYRAAFLSFFEGMSDLDVEKRIYGKKTSTIHRTIRRVRKSYGESLSINLLKTIKDCQFVKRTESPVGVALKGNLDVFVNYGHECNRIFIPSSCPSGCFYLEFTFRGTIN